MSDAADRLARSRLAILQQLEAREKRRDGGERASAREARAKAGGTDDPEAGAERSGGGWFSRRFGGRLDGLHQASRTWWRHHPAHMALEVATPILSSYARRNPVMYLGIAAAVGAVVVVARPWRLMSATGLVVALLKSSQISNLVMSAVAGADFGKDPSPYEE